MTAPRHVLMTTDTVGGVWSYSVQLAQQLSQAGVHITLAAYGAPVRPAQLQQVRALDNVELIEGAYRLEWMEDPWSDVDAAGEWLLDLAAAGKPDIVHLNDYSHGSLPFPAPKLVVAHSDVLSWWDAVIGGAAPDSWNMYRQRVAAGLRGADHRVAVSGALADFLAHAYDVDRPHVIYNARDVAAYSSGPKQDLVFSSGRAWDDAKNLRALDEAAVGLPWPVCIAGALESPDGNLTSMRNIQPLGLLSSSEMRHRYSAASIYALPAKYEPFGLSVLEAALSGCALVLGDVPSLRELWDGCALFVSPDDIAELRHALLQIIEHPEQRAKLATVARRRAEDYNPDRMIASYLRAYADARSQFDIRMEAATSCAS